MIKYWTASSWERHMPDENVPEQSVQNILLHTAKNEAESAQIFLRSDKPFEIYEMTADGLEGFTTSIHLLDTISFRDGIPYPDPLSNQKSRKVEANYTQGLWVTIRVPANANAGKHKGYVRIQTSQQEIVVEVSVHVYEVVVPDGVHAAFSLEYWTNMVGFWWRNPHLEQKDFLAEQYGCKKYDKHWWKVIGAIADNLRENRVNVLFVRTHDLLKDGGSALLSNGEYQFDWSLFDQFVSFFLQRAEIKKLAGFHLVKQTEGKEAYVLVPDETGKLVVKNTPLESEEAKRWFSQFLPALHHHLVEKNWISLWIQHIEDEPAEPESWLSVRKLVGKYMPGVPCFDALDCQNPAPSLQGAMDIWIPRIDIFEENQSFYNFRLSQGETRWTYTCCVPNTPNYLNKFIDLPYWQNRLLFWGCFLRGFTGFLHWGYNFWDTEDEYFGMNPNAFFKGDGYIIYPDPESGGIRSSARMENTRDSAEDYELLILLATVDPEKAYRLAGELMSSFHDVTWNVEKMQHVRLELLQTVEKAYAVQADLK